MKHTAVSSTAPDKRKDSVVRLIKELFWTFEPGLSEEEIKTRLFGQGGEVDIVWDKGHIVAFSISRIQYVGTYKIWYLIGVLIDKDYQSFGLSSDLMKVGLARNQPDYLLAITQVPRVYASVLSLGGGPVYPNERHFTPEHIWNITKSVTGKQLDASSDYPIVRNMYKVDRTDRLDRECRDESINSFFKKNLGTHDAFVLVAALSGKDYQPRAEFFKVLLEDIDRFT